ncbi:hypothetical protein AJ78_05845 [Emergomyces pasteurianus Ep9510]|uniref:Short-chain dehydrogenase/reductase 3 n=1 Tax=Emergomyces pasteurianus Ep9510 TaxID=1447872 RepID=A0A1J9QEW8_9EURO|nr:hypothetical protein AJ78_05845 [Emergomyces pasteurianus Ep9510]
MASRRWPSREGFTADVVGHVLKSTALAPSLTLPLYLLSKYTARGQAVAANRPKALKALKYLLAIGLARSLNGLINRYSLNHGISDTYDWKQEIAIVTGGSDGIGRRVAGLLAARGVNVAVLDIQPLKYHPPPNVRYFQCDIGSVGAIAAAAAEVRAALGEPSILINNAGIAMGTTILDGTEASTRKLFDVNTLSHYWLAREFLPKMIERNHGMVVTVASQAGYVVSANMVDYSATKSAAVAFHEGLTTELVTRYNAPRVRTVLVSQGFARTYLSRHLNADDTFFNPLLEPETVAEALVQQVLTGSSGHIMLPGSTGFFARSLRVFPYWFQNRIRDKCERLMRPPSMR